ncbi:Proteophosphoglycan ppg4 [Rhodotorula toruloides ATCC 204091]|uniref:Proteophosphoglycan ppg4 n=2 Tax=Rhodotorula toruloides TaxID=5286 RepID=A0A2T0ADI1_RHOTO|nr:Proteophosphoglycan ppg4 [Rhodotorula toruloides ATCC 204091]KAK4333845.1 Proteophosphoglycan ppg4 [Rhodotorula toruloides]PRQ76058.1 Proteophosphoglycan ppg4 [Rhodotorula toruloides]
MRIGETLGFSKTATFLATVTVHELVQVPLLNAKFRIKWKFKGATHSSALDDPANSHHSARAAAGFAEASRRFLHPRTAALSSSQGSSASASDGGATEKEGGLSRSRSGSPLGMAWSSEEGGDARTARGGRPLSRGITPPVSPDQDPRPRSTSREGGGMAFTSPFSKDGNETLYTSPPPGSRSGNGTPHDSHPASPDGPDLMRRRGAGDLSSMPLTSPPSGSSSRNVSGPTAIAHRPEPKGTTTFVPLRSHTATFNREITCPVLVTLRAVGGGKYELQTSPVRFAIKQEVVLEDGKREEERLGEVLLDLSQFAKPNGAASDVAKPRRYLLQGCKSNAVLRVSVKMEWLDGERNFVAPIPRSAQIATGSPAAKGLVSTTNSPASRSTLSLNHKSSATNLNGASTPNGRPRTSSSTTSTSASRFSLRRTNSVSSAGSSSLQNGAGSPEMSRTSSRQGPANDRLAVPGSESRQGSGSSASTSANSALSISIPGGRNSNKKEKSRGKDKKHKKGGWHPPRSSVVGAFAYATAGSAAPFETGVGASMGTATDRSATDVIDAIFNRPARPTYSTRPSWAVERSDTEGGGKMSGTSTPTGRLGAPFEYPQGEAKQHHHLGINSHHFGFDRFKGKKGAPKEKEEGKRVPSQAWSMRSVSGSNNKEKEKVLQETVSPTGVAALPTFPSAREDPPTPIGATYAQVEAPAVRKKQEERAKLVRDVTYEIGVARGEQQCTYDALDGDTSSSDDGEGRDGRRATGAKSRFHPPGPSVEVQPPTPQIPFPRTDSSPALASRATARPKPPSPSSSAHSSAANSAKPLSVRWGDQSTSTSSSAGSTSSSAAPSPATSVLPSPSHRQLRHQRSTDSALSVGRQSTRSAPLDTPSSASRQSHTSRLDPPPSRPASSLSFNSFVTPPSPPPVKDKRHKWGVLGVNGGRKERRSMEKPGERAPGGIEWGKSWA